MSSKALIIDDSPIVRRVLSLVLKSQKISSNEACNGAEALSLIRKDNSYELLLVDWNMPQMNGRQFITEVKKDSQFKHMKLFVVTANDTLRTAELAKQLGADDFLIKPISRSVVAQKLSDHGIN